MDFRKFLSIKRGEPSVPTQKTERTGEDLALDREFLENVSHVDFPDYFDACRKVSEELSAKGMGNKKKWFAKSAEERERLLSEWNNQAKRIAFDGSRADYLLRFYELKKQWAERLSQTHDKVLKDAESDPSLRDIYERVIQDIFRSGSGIQFEVKGVGNVSGVSTETGGFCSYKFDPELKRMTSVETSELSPDIDERHRTILPVSITEPQYDSTKDIVFQEKIRKLRSMMPEGKERYFFYVQQFIQGKQGNIYYSDERPGHSYTIGIVLDLNIDPSLINQTQTFDTLQDIDLRKIIDMVANTFIPEYNQAIKDLADGFNKGK